MPRFLALLRGINVGGRNKVAMADLRLIATDLGYTDVATYIQSGNLLFASEDEDAAGHARTLERRIAERLRVRPAVVVISAADLARALADNPFPHVSNPRIVHAAFAATEPTAAELARIAAEVRRARANGCTDDAVVVGRTLYLLTPDGFGRSELAARLTAAAGPARNWATVTRLAAMLTGAR